MKTTILKDWLLLNNISRAKRIKSLRAERLRLFKKNSDTIKIISNNTVKIPPADDINSGILPVTKNSPTDELNSDTDGINIKIFYVKEHISPVKEHTFPVVEDVIDSDLVPSSSADKNSIGTTKLLSGAPSSAKPPSAKLPAATEFSSAAPKFYTDAKLSDTTPSGDVPTVELSGTITAKNLLAAILSIPADDTFTAAIIANMTASLLPIIRAEAAISIQLNLRASKLHRNFKRKISSVKLIQSIRRFFLTGRKNTDHILPSSVYSCQ